MSKKSVSRNAVFTMALVAISCLVLVSVLSTVISRPVKMEPAQSRTKIITGNATRSLEIIKTELSPNGRLVRLAVKNVTNKNVDWFRISLGAGSDVEADFAFAERSILGPGEVYEDEYPLDSQLSEVKIIVVSVLFEDKGFDGDTHYAELLLEKRKGQRLELSRLVPLLRGANSDWTNRSSSTLLENLASEVSNTTNENKFAAAAKSSLKDEARLIGIRTARNRLLNDIKRIQSLDDQNRKNELAKLEARYNSINSKLAGYVF